MRLSLLLYCFVVLFIATQASKKVMDPIDEEQLMDRCGGKCVREMPDPVCARLASGDELQREEFIDLCELELFNCMHKTDYTVVHTGKC